MVDTLVVYNRQSGSNDQLEELKIGCRENKIEAEFIALSSLDSKFKKMHKSGVKAVVVAGGDGTVSAVAGRLVGSGIKLGVVPVGTLNHFAKDLKIPLGVNEALAVIKKGKVSKIDTAEVNGQVFINNSSIGVYPDLVRTRQKLEQTIGKWPAAIWGLLVHLPTPRAYKHQLVVDGQVKSCHTPFIFVGNNSYNINELGINNRTEITKGELCIYIIESKSSLKIIWLALQSIVGKTKAEAGFETYLTTQFEIRARHRKTADVALDGEVKRLQLPLNYRICPKSLNVIIP